MADDISVDADATDEFLEGDFIELNDLCSLASSSPNSDNSINMLDSDEYFDVDALLRDLESESGLDMREEHIDCVSTFVRSDQAISRSSPTGSLSIRSHTLMVEEPLSPISILGNGLVSTSTPSLLSPDPQCSRAASTCDTSQGNQNLTEKADGSPTRPGSSSVDRDCKAWKRYFCFALFLAPIHPFGWSS
ncbi:hypothetical protein J5N97_000357 [Dioscorea zingiberensis]|uniref:Uncharacterized protein n=1 Tax=Dioscorea zingiberensis TaxID=325984 RepID=A0A9D5BV47_9LILI|nr:hypothetical protein J5N97_000357 [Dioscorea zingiberensis]